MAKAIAKLSRSSKPSHRRDEDESVPPSRRPDLSAVMDHFNRALSLLIVCQRSLAEFEELVPEQQVIREAIAKFMAVYEEIDAADQALKAAGNGAL